MKSESSSVFVTFDEIIQIYSWRFSYGQAIMEEERISGEMVDAAVCVQSGRKYCVPSTPARRRQIHSEKWFEAMRDDKRKFMEFLAQKVKEVSE